VPATEAAQPAQLEAGSEREQASPPATQEPATLDRLPKGRWQSGRNYQPIVPAQPTNVAAGNVEVLEMFWYGCSHCYELDPFLESWKTSSKPAFVEFVRVPVIWDFNTKAHARLYYTLQALGREADLHGKVFDAIHRDRNPLLAADDEAAQKAQAAWAARYGVDERQFNAAYRSFNVDSALRRAEQLTRRYRVTSTPVLIVNGKYSTDVGSAGGHAPLLELLNDLANSERRR
jgi:thiol:disulfide interchange protein DsbA